MNVLKMQDILSHAIDDIMNYLCKSTF